LEMLKLKEASEQGENQTLTLLRDLLPSILVDHNFYEDADAKKKMDNREVASLVFESLDLTVKVVNEYTHAAFFFPYGRERRQIASLCCEVFNGRRSAELYAEYGHWLFYITDIYLPCCDSESGDFRHLPFAGSLMDQPYMSMQILKLIQLNYRRHVHEQAKKMTQKH